MKKFVARLKGVPAAVLTIGAGFVMAATADLNTAMVMSIAVLACLALSALVMALLNKVIPSYAKLPVYLLMITGFVSAAGMLLEAYYPETVELLGLHIAALAASLVAFRGEQEKKISLIDAVLTGICFVVVMALCGAIREVLGSATLGGDPVDAMETYKISQMAGAFGGYLVLSVVLALFNMLGGASKKAKEDN